MFYINTINEKGWFVISGWNCIAYLLHRHWNHRLSIPTLFIFYPKFQEKMRSIHGVMKLKPGYGQISRKINTLAEEREDSVVWEEEKPAAPASIWLKENICLFFQFFFLLSISFVDGEISPASYLRVGVPANFLELSRQKIRGNSFTRN